jgi:hypothetical protein
MLPYGVPPFRSGEFNAWVCDRRRVPSNRALVLFCVNVAIEQEEEEEPDAPMAPLSSRRSPSCRRCS